MTLFSARYQQPRWPNHDTKQRVFAASLTVSITIFLSLQFKHKINKISENEFLNRPFTILMFHAPEKTPKNKNQTATQKPIINKLKFITSAAKQAEKPIDSPSLISAKIAPVQTIEQAITLLPINTKTIAKAYNDSKSDIQKMAEASAKELNTTVRTKYDKFQTAAEEAVIPDCFSANSGGTLLSIPVLAYKALADKCK